jgi:hypothetical protein
MAATFRHLIPRKLFLLRDSDEYQRWTYEPRHYPRLPEVLREQLGHLEPTVRGDGNCYWPVQATLHDGRIIDRVCVMDAQAYMASFQRPWPELLRDTETVSALDIAAFGRCPCRLPRAMVNKLLRSAEFRAGASAYTLTLRNGDSWSVLALEDPFDFTCLPEGLCCADIVSARPMVTGELDQMHPVGRPTWCLANIDVVEE